MKGWSVIAERRVSYSYVAIGPIIKIELKFSDIETLLFITFGGAHYIGEVRKPRLSSKARDSGKSFCMRAVRADEFYVFLPIRKEMQMLDDENVFHGDLMTLQGLVGRKVFDKEKASQRQALSLIERRWQCECSWRPLLQPRFELTGAERLLTDGLSLMWRTSLPASGSVCRCPLRATSAQLALLWNWRLVGKVETPKSYGQSSRTISTVQHARTLRLGTHRLALRSLSGSPDRPLLPRTPFLHEKPANP